MLAAVLGPLGGVVVQKQGDERVKGMIRKDNEGLN